MYVIIDVYYLLLQRTSGKITTTNNSNSKRFQKIKCVTQVFPTFMKKADIVTKITFCPQKHLKFVVVFVLLVIKMFI